MSATIRQEINIIDAPLVNSSPSTTVTGSEIIQLDTTQYNGTVSYYFEVVGKDTVGSGNGTYRLRRKGTSTDDATVVITSSSNTIARSTAFTPPSGQTEYVLALTTASLTQATCLSARIVIIQTSTTLTNTETQIEIGNQESQTSATAVALTKPKYWKYDASKWDGTKTFYAEVTGKRDSSTMSSSTWTLQESDGTGDGFVGFTDKVTIINATTSTTAARTRVSFTPTDGRNYRISSKDSDTMNGGHTTYNAKIIVDQYGASAQSTYYFDASQAGPTDASAVWTNDANAFDGSTTTAATSTTTNTSQTLNGTGTTAPTSGNNIISVEARAYEGDTVSGVDVNIFSGSTQVNSALDFFRGGVSDDWTSYRTLSAPSGGWTWSILNSLEARWNSGNASAGTRSVRRIEIRVTYYDGVTAITKLEPQYLLANTGLAAGTGLQTFLTTLDPTSTEWDDGAGTTTYSAAADAANGSTSVVTIIDSGGSTTYATVSSPDNQGVSTFSSVPGTSTTLDVKATTNNGDVYGVRILVAYVFSAATPAAFIAAPPYLVTRQANFRSNFY